MGKEATCRIRFGGKEWTGKAHLEEDKLTVRGDQRVVAPLYRQASVCEGWLDVPTPEGELQLELGPQAEKWASAICNPKTLIDKLGLKPSMKIATIGFSNVEWLGCLPHQDSAVAGDELDAILVSVNATDETSKIPALKPALAKRGMLWVVFPKGRQDIKDSQIFAAGKAAGLVDIKTCRFNASLTGLKFVRPKGT